MLSFSDKITVFAIGMLAGLAFAVGFEAAKFNEKLDIIIEQNSKLLIYATAKTANSQK